MNPILLDFEKLFATIKNSKNNISHLSSIEKMIENFEDKYSYRHSISTSLLTEYLSSKFRELKKDIYGRT